MRMTHTYVVLEVSDEAYQEIRDALERAGYQHAFGKDRAYGEVIDMHGIALAKAILECPDCKFKTDNPEVMFIHRCHP